MKVIIGSNGSGKTCELIKMSAETGYHIVCKNKKEAYRIWRYVIDNKISMPFPLTFSELISKEYYAPGIKGILIDGIDYLLYTIINDLKIEAVTVNAMDNFELIKLEKE